MNSYNSEPVDEFTPLLDSVPNGQTLPPILPVLARVSASSGQEIPIHNILPYPLVDQSTETAFTLAVLLQLRLIETQSFTAITAYERWFRTSFNPDSIETLEKQIIRVWSQFLDRYRDVREVETVLWTQFPLEIRGLKTVRGWSIICHVFGRLFTTFRSCRFPGKLSGTDLPPYRHVEPFPHMAPWYSYKSSFCISPSYE